MSNIFLETSMISAEFCNKDLQKATNQIFKLGDKIRNNWFEIAYIVAKVAENESYKEDGFRTVHDWTAETFGFKKSASYALLTIGKDYTTFKADSKGRITGFKSNLVPDGSPDFSKTQIERMLPAGREMIVQLIANDEITTDMSAKKISEVVKQFTSHVEAEEGTEVEEEATEAEEASEETPEIEVWDKGGVLYMIPANVLDKYRV